MGSGGNLVAYFILMNQHSNLLGWVGAVVNIVHIQHLRTPPPILGPSLYLKDRQKETHTEEKRAFIHQFTPQMPATSRAEPGRSYEPGLPWSSTWVALEPSQLLPRLCVSRELQPKLSNPHSDWALREGMWVSQVTIWAYYAQHPPLQCLLMDNRTMIS